MRKAIFEKAKYFLRGNVSIVGETDYSISFKVGRYHVVAKYINHKLHWLCECNNLGNLCAHKIAAQSYLVNNFQQVSEVKEVKILTEEVNIGLSKLTEKQKEILKEMVNNKCQKCGMEKPLEIHRIRRGNKGGLYVPNNILVICNDCHKELHGGEFL